MKKYFTTTIGRLRLYGFLEGMSLLILVFIAMPVKYYLGDPGLVRSIGPVHGALFLLFVVGALHAGLTHRWQYLTIFKVLISSFIPFGNFYVDQKILNKLQQTDDAK
jgi:integral membrane protein